MACSVRDFLVRESYICEIASNFSEAEEKLFRFQYDCILLDIMLPDGNGLNLLKLIKTEQLQTNVLVISAKNGLDDKVTGLEEGADDYITKPFHLPELHAYNPTERRVSRARFFPEFVTSLGPCPSRRRRVFRARPRPSWAAAPSFRRCAG